MRSRWHFHAEESSYAAPIAEPRCGAHRANSRSVRFASRSTAACANGAAHPRCTRPILQVFLQRSRLLRWQRSGRNFGNWICPDIQSGASRVVRNTKRRLLAEIRIGILSPGSVGFERAHVMKSKATRRNGDDPEVVARAATQSTTSSLQFWSGCRRQPCRTGLTADLEPSFRCCYS